MVLEKEKVIMQSLSELAGRIPECIHRDEKTLQSLLKIDDMTAVCSKCKTSFTLDKILKNKENYNSLYFSSDNIIKGVV